MSGFILQTYFYFKIFKHISYCFLDSNLFPFVIKNPKSRSSYGWVSMRFVLVLIYSYTVYRKLILSFLHNELGEILCASLFTIPFINNVAFAQNCLYIWVRDHRQHHRHSDTDGDPHNSQRGFFFSHIGWLMSRKHPDVIAKGKLIDMKDLDADPFVMFQKRSVPLLTVLWRSLAR